MTLMTSPSELRTCAYAARRACRAVLPDTHATTFLFQNAWARLAYRDVTCQVEYGFIWSTYERAYERVCTPKCFRQLWKTDRLFT